MPRRKASRTEPRRPRPGMAEVCICGADILPGEPIAMRHGRPIHKTCAPGGDDR
jgi:hypothetical protein